MIFINTSTLIYKVGAARFLATTMSAEDAMSAAHTMYGYFPSKEVAITFVTLYGVSTLCHLAQATYYRAYWMYATAVFCGTIEVLGWVGRLWSSISPFLKIPFQIQ